MSSHVLILPKKVNKNVAFPKGQGKIDFFGGAGGQVKSYLTSKLVLISPGVCASLTEAFNITMVLVYFSNPNVSRGKQAEPFLTRL